MRYLLVTLTIHLVVFSSFGQIRNDFDAETWEKIDLAEISTYDLFNCSQIEKNDTGVVVVIGYSGGFQSVVASAGFPKRIPTLFYSQDMCKTWSEILIPDLEKRFSIFDRTPGLNEETVNFQLSTVGNRFYLDTRLGRCYYSDNGKDWNYFEDEISHFHFEQNSYYNRTKPVTYFVDDNTRILYSDAVDKNGTVNRLWKKSDKEWYTALEVDKGRDIEKYKKKFPFVYFYEDKIAIMDTEAGEPYPLIKQVSQNSEDNIRYILCLTETSGCSVPSMPYFYSEEDIYTLTKQGSAYNLLSSSNKGASFKKIDIIDEYVLSAFPLLHRNGTIFVYALPEDDSLFGSSFGRSRFYKSHDKGESWIDLGIPPFKKVFRDYIFSDNGHLIIASEGEVLISRDRLCIDTE